MEPKRESLSGKVSAKKLDDNDFEDVYCPWCDEQLDNFYGEEDFDGEEFHQDASCSNCGAEIRYVYSYKLDRAQIKPGELSKKIKDEEDK